MNGLALTRLLHNVIREYGKYDGVNYSVSLSEIDLADRKLLLSHILDSGEYEWAMKSSSRINAYFDENRKHIQNLIDNECQEVYQEDMEEMGMHSSRDASSNELMWERR